MGQSESIQPGPKRLPGPTARERQCPSWCADTPTYTRGLPSPARPRFLNANKEQWCAHSAHKARARHGTGAQHLVTGLASPCPRSPSLGSDLVNHGSRGGHYDAPPSSPFTKGPRAPMLRIEPGGAPRLSAQLHGATWLWVTPFPGQGETRPPRPTPPRDSSEGLFQLTSSGLQARTLAGAPLCPPTSVPPPQAGVP